MSDKPQFDKDDYALIFSMLITVGFGVGCLVVVAWAVALEMGWMV